MRLAADARMEAMKPSLEFLPDDRVLVLAPHPDDEVLATGGLIQQALAAGAALRVIVATDGDNNPWPQRWVEKRWRIDATARERWGRRRRAEGLAALSCLGVADTDVRFLGWPDSGLTDRLLADADGESCLAEEITRFRPSVLVAPVLGDTHPDHSALRVMLELALAQADVAPCRRLGFRVHGIGAETSYRALTLNAEQVQRKQDATLAHTSQLVLSRARMLRYAQREECFLPVPASVPLKACMGARWRMPLPGMRGWGKAHVLVLVLVTSAGVARRVLPLRDAVQGTAWDITLEGNASLRFVAHRHGDHIDLSLQGQPLLHKVFCKIHRQGERLFIHDARGWMDVLAEAATEHAPAG